MTNLYKTYLPAKLVILGISHVSTTQRAFCDNFKSLRALFNVNLMRFEFVKTPLMDEEAPVPITAVALAPVPNVAVADAPVPTPAPGKLNVVICIFVICMFAVT